MLIINNKIINESIYNILLELQKQIHFLGINKLRDIKKQGNDARVTCPNHKNGMENNPSCGISLIEDEKLKLGTCHCFTCGLATSFENFISLCFNREDSGEYGKEWLLENFNYNYLENERDLSKLFINNKEIKKDIVYNYITEKELQKYRYYHEYMWKRKLTPEIVEKFDIGFDKTTNCLTFPVYDDKGNCLFIARRSVSYKWFNYPEEIEKPIYGLEKIDKNIKEVIVCESFINALTCWVYGKEAIALIGTGTKKQYEILKNSHIRHFILAFDGDDAGRKGDKRFRKNLSNYKLINSLVLPEGKDINDLSKEEFEKLKMV